MFECFATQKTQYILNPLLNQYACYYPAGATRWWRWDCCCFSYSCHQHSAASRNTSKNAVCARSRCICASEEDLACILGVMYMGLLPDAPEAARIFSAGEPDNAQKRLNREPTNFELTAVQPIRRLRKLLQYARQLPDWQDCLHGYRQPNSSRLGILISDAI